MLGKGEIGIELDGSDIAIHFKMGPGNWNDLKYMEDAVYPYSDTVTNEIGDVKIGEDRSGNALSLIIRDMIEAFISVAVSNPRNNAAGNAATIAIMAIGQTVFNNVIVSYTLNSLGILNLVIGNNINIVAGGIFSNEGFLTHGTGSIIMTLVNDLNPSSLTTYQIDIFARDSKGDSPVVSTYIKFQPEILWGNSALTSLLANEIASLPNRRTTDTYKDTFVFGNIDYPYIAIPVMLGISNPVFANISNPNAPSVVSMLDMGLFNDVNNGTGIYDYRLYRGEFAGLNPITLIVS